MPAPAPRLNPDDVFINCPFDDAFAPHFRAMVFAVIACGFRVRCALELDDATGTRIDKLLRIIGQCRYGIHDISRVELDPASALPRFNMPFELGLFLGARHFGGRAQATKACMVQDRVKYRYQQFLSDIAGQDVKAHDDRPEKTVRNVHAFLSTTDRREGIPALKPVLRSFERFTGGLPAMAHLRDLEADDLLFADLEKLVRE